MACLHSSLWNSAKNGRRVLAVKTMLLSFFLSVALWFAQTSRGDASLFAKPGSTTSALSAQHQEVLNALNTFGKNGAPLELDEPQVPELLERGWDLAGNWAAKYLDAHPSPSEDELKNIFDGFAPKPNGVKSKYGDFLEYPDYWFAGTAIEFGKSVYAIEASYGRDMATSTFMVLAKDETGHFRPCWNVKKLAKEHFAQRDEIGRWLHLVRRSYYNGPLTVRAITAVRPAASGHPRFLVDAYQAADGGAVLGQLSIWEWTGSEAKPLLIKLYEYADDEGVFQFDGTTLRITTKESLRTFFSCGMCPEPRGLWTVRITPSGVKDMGHRFLKPEYQWADELLSRFYSGQGTSNLANGGVVTALRKKMEEIRRENARFNISDSEFLWGMLGECRVFRRGDKGKFELKLDEATLRFTYLMRNGKPYFTAVSIR